MAKPTLGAKLRYWFDNVMGRGTVALLGLLAVLAAIFVLINTAVVVWFKVGPDGADGGEQSVAEVLWSNVVRVLDSEDVAPGANPAFRFVMLVITIVGVLIAATLVGIIASAFDVKVAGLRKGRSAVLETGHTVILGWDAKVPALVHALVEANASKPKSSIVILSATDQIRLLLRAAAAPTRPGRGRA